MLEDSLGYVAKPCIQKKLRKTKQNRKKCAYVARVNKELKARDSADLYFICYTQHYNYDSRREISHNYR